jgi:hypothetical protein
MATYMTIHPGNTALQTEIWTLTLAEAKAVLPTLDTQPGSYWYFTVAQPYRRARKDKATAVRVHTAGLSSGEFSNALAATRATIHRSI